MCVISAIVPLASPNGIAKTMIIFPELNKKIKIKNKSFSLHNICVCAVYIYYVYTNTCMYVFKKNML